MSYATQPPPPLPHPSAHSSSDSTSFSHSIHSYSTDSSTPHSHIQHINSHDSIGASHDGSPTHYRSQTSINSMPHPQSLSHTSSYDDKHDPYAGYSTADGTTYQSGYTQSSQSSNWSGAQQSGHDNSLPSPAVSAASYATLPGQLGYPHDQQQAHQLPHVHQTLPRQPSSNDLRVMYPALG